MPLQTPKPHQANRRPTKRQPLNGTPTGGPELLSTAPSAIPVQTPSRDTAASSHTSGLILPTQRVTLTLPAALIERLRNAIYWTAQHTMARVITDAIHDAVAEMEHANGGTFPPRLTPLKRGRPRRASAPSTQPAIGSAS